jgi:hypothetical protein
MSQELIVSHQYVGVNDGDMNNESIEGYWSISRLSLENFRVMTEIMGLTNLWPQT